LHPLDMDGKFGLAAGFGNYRNANAMALGVFYRPTDRVMFSVGGSMGNGENMMNAGVSIALDKGVNTSKAAMARKIHAQDTEIQTLKAENAEIKEQNAKLAERLAAIEAKLGK
ncbi:MAG: YadA-like family protein, partial [Acidaminococcaceae bacterium]|nr:YadA-like family protein [Acidaminococcaceae bacterium]